MAALRVLLLGLPLLALALAPLPSAHAAFSGGSSTIAPYVQALIAAYNAATSSDIPADYESVNSQAGIDGVKSGKYQIAASIRPFSSAEESGFSKFTLPFAILTVSAFSSSPTPAAFALSPAQVAGILRGTIKTWQSIPGSGLTGAITFVGRSDDAAITALVTGYLRAALVANWPSNLVGEGPFNFGAPNAIYVKGANAVAEAIKNTPNSFGFLQSGVGATKFGLPEILLKNKAGVGVGASKDPRVDVYAALPITPPLNGGSWAGVNLLYKPGPSTPAIESFAYFFTRVKYPRAVGTKVKGFLTYVLSPAGQNVANNYYFYNLPQKYITPALKAVNAIVLV